MRGSQRSVNGYSTREVAELLGMKPARIRAFARAGLLSSQREPRHAYRFRFEDVVLLRPRPLLVVHGEADTVLPIANAELIYGWASEPKQLVTYAGAGHGLRECRAELRELLLDWLTESLDEPTAN